MCWYIQVIKLIFSHFLNIFICSYFKAHDKQGLHEKLSVDIEYIDLIMRCNLTQRKVVFALPTSIQTEPPEDGNYDTEVCFHYQKQQSHLGTHILIQIHSREHF